MVNSVPSRGLVCTYGAPSCSRLRLLTERAGHNDVVCRTTKSDMSRTEMLNRLRSTRELTADYVDES